jgi:hypothetical protein
MNTVCRLEQLRVSNFVIAAFDAEALAFCSDRVLPCFAALPDDADNTSAAFENGSDAFRALTKLKSVQVCRRLIGFPASIRFKGWLLFVSRGSHSPFFYFLNIRSFILGNPGDPPLFLSPTNSLYPSNPRVSESKSPHLLLPAIRAETHTLKEERRLLRVSL